MQCANKPPARILVEVLWAILPRAPIFTIDSMPVEI